MCGRYYCLLAIGAGQGGDCRNTSSVHACLSAGVEDSMLGRRFCGIGPELRSAPPEIASQQYPSVQNQPDLAAAELGRLASLRKVHWKGKGYAPPDLRVRPPQLIAKAGKVRVVRGRPNHEYGLNEASVNPPVKYGDMYEFSWLLSPGAFPALTRVS